jgi:hypothetical protein
MALEGCEGSVSRPGRSLPPGKTRYRRLGGPEGQSGQVQKILPPPGFDLRNVQPVASRYTNYATRPTKISRTYGIYGWQYHPSVCTGNVTFWFLTQPYSISYQYTSMFYTHAHRVLLKQPACPPQWQLLRIKKLSWATQILRMWRRRSLTF